MNDVPEYWREVNPTGGKGRLLGRNEQGEIKNGVTFKGHPARLQLRVSTIYYGIRIISGRGERIRTSDLFVLSLLI